MEQTKKTVVPNPFRKPYEKLTLESYGSLRQLTANVSMAGMADGGMGNDKTSN